MPTWYCTHVERPARVAGGGTPEVSLERKSMNARELMGWVTDNAYEEKYNIYSIAVHGERDGRLPTATVITDKVNGKIAGHFVCVDEKAGKVKFFTGTYFDREAVPLAAAMEWFGKEVSNHVSTYV